jgi:plastocyanin
MHTVAVQLAPVLGAEKSKVPFYIAGGALVLWALVVSLVLGLRKPDFPGNLAGQRAVSAVSAVLVLAAISTAVITSGGSKAAEAAAGEAETQAATTPPATSSTAAPGETATAPAAAPSKGSELTLSADTGGLLRYNTKQLSAKAGTVKITFSNPAQLEHNVTIAEVAKVIGATATFAGGSRSLTLTLKPGKYTFFCSVPGHRQAGMEGTLNVS